MSDTLATVVAQNIARMMAQRADLNSQPKLASATGLGQSTIGRVLRGEVAATLDSIEAIAKAFGISPAELLAAPHKSDDQTILIETIGLTGIMWSARAATADQIFEAAFQRPLFPNFLRLCKFFGLDILREHLNGAIGRLSPTTARVNRLYLSALEEANRHAAAENVRAS